MAVSSATYHIGLQIPLEAQRRIHDYAAVMRGDNASLRIPAVGNFSVHLMTVESQSRDDLSKIRRAFASVQGSLQQQGDASFSLFTPKLTLVADRTVAALRVRSCGLPVPGWTQQGSIGHLRRLLEMLTTAFQQEGIDPQRVTSLEVYAPYVPFIRTNDSSSHFSDSVETSLPEQSQLQWQTSVMGLFVQSE